MNLLQKQGSLNSIILYFGIALGFFNSVVLFQHYLSLQEIGFFGLLVSLTTLYAQLASLGLNNIILRYFPYFSTHDKKHQGFITFVAGFTILSFLIFTLLFVGFKSSILDFYKEKQEASLLVRFYYFLIPVAFFTLVYNILESLARAIFQNVLSAFLREVLLRSFTTLALLLIMVQMADYHDFLNIYLLANVFITLILAVSVYQSRQFGWSRPSDEVKGNVRSMLSFGIFSVLSGGSFALIQYLDIIMLSALTEQSLVYVGVYTTLFGIAVVINLPAKALNRTSYQIISNAWKENEFAKIARIYEKTSVVQSLLGCLLLAGLLVNWHNLVFLLHKPEYHDYFWVFVMVGLAGLVDITGGLNSHIISSSVHYKFVTLSLVIAVAVCAALNILLIPQIGIFGAALAYLLTMTGLNFTYWLFIKLKFGFQPFGRSHLRIFLISGIAFLAGWLLPYLFNFWIDVAVRSLLTGSIYLILAYRMAISEDINQFVDQIWQKLKQFTLHKTNS